MVHSSTFKAHFIAALTSGRARIEAADELLSFDEIHAIDLRTPL